MNDVAAIVTAMTDGERPFLYSALRSVLADPQISQVILCIEQHNHWLQAVLDDLLDDPRLEVLRLPMALPGRIRNQALQRVRCTWVAYCDGDDVWCPHKTRQQLHDPAAQTWDLIGADHYLTDEAGKIRAFALARHIPMPSSWIVRTEIMRAYPFDETLPTGSDGEWWRRTDRYIRKKRCPKLLLKYRVRRHSVSSQTASKRRKAQIIQLTQIPVVGQLIYSFTWGLWHLTRQKRYLWHPHWAIIEAQPSSTVPNC